MEEENKASEISIQADKKLPETYVVTIDNKFFINVTVADRENKIREWIRGVQAIYGKKNRRNLIVGLSALCSQHYANGGFNYGRPKANRGEKPYDLLQLCVGSHCLVMEVYPYDPLPRIVKDFLYDNKTVVVGVGIEKIATKLKKDWKDEGLMIRKRVELREEAGKMFPGSDFGKCSLEDLAMAVLGGEVVFVRPKKVKWWGEIEVGHIRKLTKELIKLASVEAFLAAKMGSTLLKNSQ